MLYSSLLILTIFPSISHQNHEINRFHISIYVFPAFEQDFDIIPVQVVFTFVNK